MTYFANFAKKRKQNELQETSQSKFELENMTSKLKLKDLKRCSNSTCPETQKLRKCAGCKTARYCSIACQKADWKQHKKLCQQTSLRLQKSPSWTCVGCSNVLSSSEFEASVQRKIPPVAYWCGCAALNYACVTCVETNPSYSYWHKKFGEKDGGKHKLESSLNYETSSERLSKQLPEIIKKLKRDHFNGGVSVIYTGDAE